MKNKVLTALLLLAIGSASANRYYVNDLSQAGDVYTTATGSNSNPGTAAQPFATLTYALTLASANDTILVDAGTYADKNLTISLTNLSITGAGSNATVFNNNFANANSNYFIKIQANGVNVAGLMAIKYNSTAVSTGKAITVSGATGVQLIDVVLTNNYGSGGGNGALYVGSNASVTIRKGSYSCNPNSGATNDYGGGIDIVGQHTVVSIDSAAVSNNGKTAFEGGGIYITGDSTCVVSITNSTLNGNSAMNGGAIYATLLSGLSTSTPGPVLTVRNSCFDSNFSQDLSAFSYGGAVTIYSGKAKFVNCSFTSNTGGKGGAIAANSNDGIITLNVDSCYFSGNTSSQGNNGYDLYARVAFSHANTVTCNQNTFSAAASSVVNGNTASISVSNSGNPGTTGTSGSVTFVNTSAPAYATTTSCVAVTGSCVCTIPAIISGAPAASICSGSVFSTALASSTPGVYTNYSWTSNAVSGITGHSTSGNGNISETLTNTTGSALTVTYNITPNYNGLCSGGVTAYSVIVNPTANASIATPAALTCTNASVTLSASSTTSGATYTWSGGGTGSTNNVTTPGNYSVTVSDPSGGCSATASVTVTQNTTLPNLSIVGPATLNCTTTSVTITASSTTSGVTYSWNGGGTTNTTTASLPGSYSVTVTDPANGCTASSSVSVAQNITVPNASIAPPATLTCTNTTVTLNASSTTAGATFNWGGGNTSATKTVSSASTYSVTVTDPANGCTATAAATVNQNITTPNLSLNTPALLTCTSGSVAVTASSLTPNVTYAWNGGATANSISVSSTGNYSVTVTDPVNGCTASAATTVNQSAGVPNLSIAPAATLTCTVTSVTLTASSTTNGVNYNWGGSNTSATNTVSSANTYTVTVTDPSNGCSAAASVTVNQNTAIPNVSITTPATLTCTSTSVTLTAASTTAGVNYNWGAGNTTSTNTVNSANTYTVTVTDPANGCTGSASATVTQNIANPEISIATHDSLTCVITSVLLTANSNTNGITYVWSNGGTTNTSAVTTSGTYTLTVTDPANGCTSTATTNVTALNNFLSLSTSSVDATCGNNNGSATVIVNTGIASNYNWSNGGNSTTISGIDAGTYTVTVTGAGGCSATASATLISTNALSISTSSANTTCGENNGSATVSVTNGTGNIFNWSNGANTSTISGLASGTYSVTVTGTGGCSATTSVIINSSTVTPVTITADQSVICSSDSSQICAPSGYSSYQWNTGETSNCIYVKQAGNYYVTVTDNAGCTVASNHLAINVHPQPSVSISVNGDSLLSYNALTYQWYFNGVIINGATSPLLIATQTGYYTVLVSDSTGCTALSLPVQVITTGINQVSDEMVNVFPNPLESGFWNLKCGPDLIGSLMEIYDDNGRLVYRTEITNQKSEIEVNFAKGIYLLRINSKQNRASKKIIKL
jgi:hypothetical protein